MASSVFLNPSITEGTATQSIIPSVDNTYDLGSSTFRWRSIYFGTQSRAADGSASAPSYSFASDPNTGLFWSTDGSIDMTGNGTARVRLLDSTGARYAITLGASTDLNWASSGVSTPDVSLSRGAANRLTLAVGDAFNLAPTAFASLPAGAEGNLACVTDSNTATWGATIAGGGANNVLAFHNGTNWTVAGA